MTTSADIFAGKPIRISKPVSAKKKLVAEIVSAVEHSAEKALPSFLAACIAKILNSGENFAVPTQNFAAPEKVEKTDISDVDLDFIGG